jgi:hypothetical protein
MGESWGAWWVGLLWGPEHYPYFLELCQGVVFSLLGSWGVGLAQYKEITKPVRHLELGPFHEAIFADVIPIKQPVALALATGFFLSVAGMLINAGWLARRRALRLACCGFAVEGIIVGLATVAPVRWFPRHRLLVEFAACSRGTCRAFVPVAAAITKTLQAGDSVTVFYDPRRPSNCVIYDAIPLQVNG